MSHTESTDYTEAYARCLYAASGVITLGATDSCERSNAAKSVKSVKSVGA